jgi:hypothetical protein
MLIKGLVSDTYGVCRHVHKDMHNTYRYNNCKIAPCPLESKQKISAGSFGQPARPVKDFKVNSTCLPGAKCGKFSNLIKLFHFLRIKRRKRVISV